MKKGTYLFISIYIIILLYKSCINYENWNSPHNLSFTYTLYKGRKIAEDEPLIIAYDKIFFLDNDLTKILYYKTGNIYTLYPGLYRMPLLYTNTIFSFYSLFVTKDYNIYLYQERGENGTFSDFIKISKIINVPLHMSLLCVLPSVHACDLHSRQTLLAQKTATVSL